MNKNYYEEKLAEIKKLIQAEDFDNAKNLINDELRMPYIPEIYESKFVELANIIKLKTFKDNGPVMTISRDVALDYLFSEDPNNTLLALEVLPEHNLKYAQDLLKKRIESWGDDKNIWKGYLFEIMVEQDIDVDINFNGKIINPSKDKSILNSKTVMEIMGKLSHSFEKNPSITESAIQEFERYLLMTYPEVPNNPDEFTKDFVKVINSMLDENIQLAGKQLIIKKILNDN